MERPAETPPEAKRKLSATPSSKHARFLDSFPEHAGLSRAVAAFEDGNYAETRRRCEELLDHEEDEDVRDAARELLHRMNPDRLIVGILWASFALLALVTLWVYSHGH